MKKLLNGFVLVALFFMAVAAVWALDIVFFGGCVNGR